MELVAKKALVCFCGFLPEMKQRATFYLPYNGSMDVPGGSQDTINEEVALAYQTRFSFASEMTFSALADDYRHVRMELRQLRHCLALKESEDRRQKMLGARGSGTAKFKAGTKRPTARSFLAQFQPIQPAPQPKADPPAQPIEDGSSDTDSVKDPPYSPIR